MSVLLSWHEKVSDERNRACERRLYSSDDDALNKADRQKSCADCTITACRDGRPGKHCESHVGSTDSMRLSSRLMFVLATNRRREPSMRSVSERCQPYCQFLRCISPGDGRHVASRCQYTSRPASGLSTGTYDNRLARYERNRSNSGRNRNSNFTSRVHSRVNCSQQNPTSKH